MQGESLQLDLWDWDTPTIEKLKRDGRRRRRRRRTGGLVDW